MFFKRDFNCTVDKDLLAVAVQEKMAKVTVRMFDLTVTFWGVYFVNPAAFNNTSRFLSFALLMF